MSEVPAGWVQCEIGEVAEVIGGGTPPSKDPTNFATEGGIPWITPADLSGYRKTYIDRGTRNLSQKGFRSCSASKLPAGTVLFSSRAPVGYVAIAANELTTNQGFKSFILPEGLDSRFVYFYLRHIKSVAEAMATGTTFKELSGANAARLPLLVAPLPEQKRVADKLDALLARVDACRERLDRVPLILKRFRQAVLAAATSGRLTEDWRGESRSYRPSNASAEELQEFTFEDAECFGAFSFPSCWGIARLHEIAAVDGGITKDTKKQNPFDEELPYLRVANVQRGFLDLSEVKTIRVPSQRVEELLLKPGDILFNEGGDLDKLGRGWVWSGEIERCTFQNHVFRVRLHDTNFEPKFFSWYGNSRGSDYFVRTGKQTTNLASINKTLLSVLPIVVPPSDEQREIVRRVEAIFAFADRLEARCRATRGQVERLTPSLLAKAFRGELVPQDPDNEPAAVLLERIRAARASAVTPTKRPRRRHPMEPKTTTEAILAGSAGIIHALQGTDRTLSGKDLFTAAGYPPDADPETVETFFVAIRDALKQGLIARERHDKVDWFSLVPQ